MSTPTPAAPRVHAVLGMHRSGTSWLAGSLQEKGLELGEVSTHDPHNQKGNRESAVLMALHDAVLADNDASWKKPGRSHRWTDARKAELAAHVARMNADYPRWGFKDPRALLVLDEWLRQVPELARACIYRHPLAVHRSLANRNPRFDESRSVALWCAYNERLVEDAERTRCPVLRFDVPPEELLRALDHVARLWRLPRADVASSFFSKDLVHNNEAAEGPVPRAARKLWDALEALRLRV